MIALAGRCAGTSGWRRAALAWVLGAVAVAALPPVSFTPALAVAFTGLVWLLDGAPTIRRAAWDGWWFGFGFFTLGLYWISNALLTNPAQFGWLLPFSLLGLPAAIAVFGATATALARLVWVPGPGRVLALAVAWSAAEWLRGHVFTGFPWNLAGYTWTWSDAMLQANAAIGIYGVSFLTVLAAASPAALAAKDGAMRRWAPPVVAVAALLLWWGAGAVRLGAALPDSGTVQVRVVQANIAEPDKWDPALRDESVRRHSLLTRSPGLERAAVVVWPETAVLYYLEYQPELAQDLGTLLPPGAVLIAGAPRGRVDDHGQLVQVWNSVDVLDERGAILSAYDKAHLVPFGEYVPLRSVLGALGLEKIVPGILDFSAGPGPRTLTAPGLPPFGPLVCYEVVFPEEVVDPRDRPAWLVNVTNDAWYGNSAGPYQHFAIARVRAVEQGLPMVRAANTGISGVIDAYGRVRARLPLGVAGVLDAALPAPLAPTWYARWGDGAYAVLLGIGAVILGQMQMRRRGAPHRAG